MAKKKKAGETETPRRMGRPATGKTPLRSFRISDADYDLICRAAEVQGVTTSDWLRDVATRAARRVIRQGNQQGEQAT